MGKRNSAFIFFIGDEGVIVSYIVGKKVEKKLLFNSADTNAQEVITNLVKADIKAPISILLDGIDQSYQTQSFPPVAKMSVQKLVNDRIKRDFSPGDITESLTLGKEKTGRQDWKFLLISVVPTPELMQWLDFINNFDNPFKGIYLVPVEAENLIKAIVKPKTKKAKADSSSAVWHMLILHNKVSGFRQVITKNGRLTFTRLTQPSSGENIPLVIAGNIEQESVSTIEYLKRIGFREDEGLDVTIIASPEIVAALDETKIGVHWKSEFLSPAQVAQKLNLAEEDYTDNHFADLLFSTYFKVLNKAVLLVQTENSLKINKLQRLKSGIKYTAFLIILGILAGAAYFGFEWYQASNSTGSTEASINASQKRLTEITAKSDELPENISEILNDVSLYQRFATQKDTPITFIQTFIANTDDGILVKSYDWSSEDDFTTVARQENKPRTVKVSVDVIKTSNNAENRIAYLNTYFARLRGAYPAYTLSFNAIEGTLNEPEGLVVDFTNASSRGLATAPISLDLLFEYSGEEEENQQQLPQGLGAIGGMQP